MSLAVALSDGRLKLDDEVAKYTAEEPAATRNASGSATGSGNIFVNSGGTLSGLPAVGFAAPGTISGTVTVNNNGRLLARSG